MALFQEKKHRLPRECYQGLVTVSFTACIEGRKTPFTDAAVVQAFLEKMQTSLAKNECVALIYCFMPDHLHVIVHGQSVNADTWRVMVDFKQKSGYWFSQHLREILADTATV